LPESVTYVSGTFCHPCLGPLMHVGVVPARVARKAPQWGLSLVQRPLENATGIVGHANSPDFLWAMMVEWSFAMHDIRRRGRHSRDHYQWKSEQPLPVRIPAGLFTTRSSNPDRQARGQRPFSGVTRTCGDAPQCRLLTQSRHRAHSRGRLSTKAHVDRMLLWLVIGCIVCSSTTRGGPHAARRQ
jgi:hypothetical protein